MKVYILKALYLIILVLFFTSCNTENHKNLDENPLVLCESGVCLFYPHKVIDSDGDNVSDEDELALNSDPLDSLVTPNILQIAEHIQDLLLPSFRKGLSELIVLPIRTPGGLPLNTDKGPVSLASIIKKKQGILNTLGISPSILGKFKINPDLGLRLQIDKAMSGTKKPNSIDRIKMRYSGVLISNKGNSKPETKTEKDTSTTTTIRDTKTTTDPNKKSSTQTVKNETKENVKVNKDKTVTTTTTSTTTTTDRVNGKKVKEQTTTETVTKTTVKGGGVHIHNETERSFSTKNDVNDTFQFKQSNDVDIDKKGNVTVSNSRYCLGFNHDWVHFKLTRLSCGFKFSLYEFNYFVPLAIHVRYA